MLGRLSKLAQISSGLRASIEKRAGIVGKTFGTLGAISGAQQAVGKTKQFKTGFDPAVQKQRLGMPEQE
jgi:hypothetical protein